jgi:hypothetical protein
VGEPLKRSVMLDFFRVITIEMSILVIIFPLLLGIAGVIYKGCPKTRRALLSITVCSLASLILILMIYNLHVFSDLLAAEAGLLVIEGLVFVFLFSLPFVLWGWSREVVGEVTRR